MILGRERAPLASSLLQRRRPVDDDRHGHLRGRLRHRVDEETLAVRRDVVLVQVQNRYSAAVVPTERFNAAAMVSSGNTSLSGSSSRRSAPKRSYHFAARSSFASIASATPPTSRLTASARSPAASSRSPPRP